MLSDSPVANPKRKATLLRCELDNRHYAHLVGLSETPRIDAARGRHPLHGSDRSTAAPQFY